MLSVFPPTYAAAASPTSGATAHLTFGLHDDVADSQSLAHIMEGLIPRITPSVDIIVGACPQHVIHRIITGTCKEWTLFNHRVATACARTSHRHC